MHFFKSSNFGLYHGNPLSIHLRFQSRRSHALIESGYGSFSLVLCSSGHPVWPRIINQEGDEQEDPKGLLGVVCRAQATS